MPPPLQSESHRHSHSSTNTNVTRAMSPQAAISRSRRQTRAMAAKNEAQTVFAPEIQPPSIPRQAQMKTRTMAAREQSQTSSATSEIQQSQNLQDLAAKPSASAKAATATAAAAPGTDDNILAASPTIVDAPHRKSHLTPTVDKAAVLGHGEAPEAQTGSDDNSLDLLTASLQREVETVIAEVNDVFSPTTTSQEYPSAKALANQAPSSQSLTTDSTSSVSTNPDTSRPAPSSAFKSNAQNSPSVSATVNEPLRFPNSTARVQANGAAVHRPEDSEVGNASDISNKAPQTGGLVVSSSLTATRERFDAPVVNSEADSVQLLVPSVMTSQEGVDRATEQQVELSVVTSSTRDLGAVQGSSMCEDSTAEKWDSSNHEISMTTGRQQPGAIQASKKPAPPIIDLTREHDIVQGPAGSGESAEAAQAPNRNNGTIANNATRSNAARLTPQSVLDSIRQGDWPIEKFSSVRQQRGFLEVFVNWSPVIVPQKEACNGIWDCCNQRVTDDGNVSIDWPSCWQPYWLVDRTAEHEAIENAFWSKEAAKYMFQRRRCELRDHGARFKRKATLGAYKNEDWRRLIKEIRAKSRDSTADALENSLTSMEKAQAALKRKRNKLCKLMCAFNLKPLEHGAELMEID